MIQGLYETHIQVRDLAKAVAFYTEVLGLRVAHRDPTRPIVFLWIGSGKDYMLGLWQEEANFQPRHFAFRANKEDILNYAVDYLKTRDLTPYNFLRDGIEAPMVFAWMPALAIYFNDPDGNQLEFISVLEGEGIPELGVLSYADWLKHTAL
ncbi:MULTISPECIES: VOC family protein [unclassified Sphingobacterium]|uniref:VOC family protein n=1 Tax=unclassified Sphingobacterium TaxID=2609468 RepID=UPI0025E52E98|nr:VOC family protein [Sphingobacterium sp. UBA5670]